ncbi:hypothetical protein Pint_18457 [Pistacia integerrima]|uniref:Uncharacterized protein n=1 Tax=Pistacia integerrima TaxID=434235 RepID=A0ACC0YXX3_9ROSI|nr:hypothetical protein Pint_18457 [Pistacia integerrima]
MSIHFSLFFCTSPLDSITRIILPIFPASQACHLYKHNRQLKLVDSKLSKFSEEEVQCLIGVALLCIQTVPSSRPSMSRVIAMLCGDIEVDTMNLKPRYLTEWTFDNVTTPISDDAAEDCDDTNHDNSSASLSKMDKTPQRSGTKAASH